MAVVGGHLGTKAMTASPAPPPQPQVVTTSVAPEPSAVDQLVAAAKGRPGLLDQFEAASKKLADDARARLKP